MDVATSETLKKIGPAFPRHGPHYDYGDLVEHIRYSTAMAKTCSTDGDLVTYHLLEIFKRRSQLAEAIATACRTTLREEECNDAHQTINQLNEKWEKVFTDSLAECFREAKEHGKT